jgi:hypothetical protein
MIAYDLKCQNGHAFEGWFEDSETFIAQKERGLIACPICNDTAIVKLPSRFSIKTSSGFKPKTFDSGEDYPLEQLGRKVADFVEKNFDDVGCHFAQEALKIHYGVTEPRNIRGVSTQEEEKLLKQEGVHFIKIPIPAPPEPEN